MINSTPRPPYPRKREAVLISEDVGWAPALVWTGAENLASTGIRSPDRPARSVSLNRLTYPGPQFNIITRHTYSVRNLCMSLSTNAALVWNLKLYVRSLTKPECVFKHRVLHKTAVKLYYSIFCYQYRAFFIIYNLTNDCTIISNMIITNNMLLHVSTFKMPSSGS